VAYIDKYAARRPNIGATAAVIVIEAMLAIAVVRGLGVTLLPHVNPANPIGIDIPLAKPPPPATEKPPVVRPDQHPIVTPPLTPPASGLGMPVGPIPLDPPAPLPTAAPLAPVPVPTPVALGRPAMPRGNPASWVSDSDYPARDLREGNQGRVGFALSLGADGKVSSCRVTSSSGYPGLDEATCTLVARRAHFTPAMGADGRPGAGSYSGTIRWVIPD